MKKIAIVAHGLGHGGAERVASILANNLSQLGYEILFISVYFSEQDYYLSDRIKVVSINTKYSNKCARLIDRSAQIKEEILHFRAEIVISFVINEMLATALKKQVPIIYSLRNDPASILQSFIKKQLCCFLYKRGKYVVFQTPNARDYFCSGIRSKGIVIANPLTSGLPVWNENTLEKRVVTVGRLAKQKNQKMLIDAYRMFLPYYPDYRLEIYGDGPLKESLLQYVADLGLSQQVLFRGFHNDIHEIMANSRIFVVSSDYEGLSNSMLESLAIGVPTICTDCSPGSARQYIDSGKNGYLVPIGDAESLCKCMVDIIADPAHAREMSKNAQAIRHLLEERHIASCWETLFDN